MAEFSWSDKPSHTAFPVARAGYPLIGAAAFATAVLALLELVLPALLGLAATLAIAAFFRDPDRVIPAEAGAVVSPADGKVLSVTPGCQGPLGQGPFVKISIFMSVLNVHINRVPCEGRVKQISYQPGGFLAANRAEASGRNERNAILLETENAQEIGCVQVAGMIARRIICSLRAGDPVIRGQRLGMICFGSRLDVYLPQNARPAVAPGDRVKGGTSVVGHLA